MTVTLLTVGYWHVAAAALVVLIGATYTFKYKGRAISSALDLMQADTAQITLYNVCCCSFSFDNHLFSVDYTH